MRKLFWKQYGSKFFALFIVVMMITVVYPVLINNAKNPSQLSAYDDDWNDIYRLKLPNTTLGHDLGTSLCVLWLLLEQKIFP